jgi:acetyltransferase-like isoleucine patch superfamily enzyme
MLNSGPPEGFIHIGSNSTVGQGSLLYGNGGLTIGNNVMIAGQCAIIASSHNYDNADIPMIRQGYTAKGITIYDNVWIGAGARILDGVTVGEGSIVGANAVVNSTVAPGDRVGGIPARSLKGNITAG